MPQRREVTSLTVPEESQFQKWTQDNKITDVDREGSFYDYRGYWKEHGGKSIKFGVDHFTDTYKQHGHPTFSEESKYSQGPGDGGRWQGERFIPPNVNKSPPGQGKDDPYRDTIAGMRRREETRLAQSLKSAVTKKPDRQAEVLKLSERTRLPSSFVERNFDEISKRYPTSEVDPSQLVRETPKTARWLSDPANAAVAKDDLPQLSYIDRMLQYGENAFRSVAAAIPATSASIYRVGHAAAELTEQLTGPVNEALGAGDFKNVVSKWFDRQAAGLETQAANVAPDPERTGPLERDVYSGIQSTAQNLLLLPLSLMSGGATATVTAMGAITGGQSYGKLRSQNVGVYRSLMSAGADGLIEAGTELIPTTVWLKELSLHTGFSKALMRSLAEELPGEQLATLLQDLNAWGNLPENAEKTLGDYARERPEAAVHTLIATLVGTAGQVGITRAVDRAVTGKSSQQLFFEQLGKGVTDSKTFARLPEKVQELIAQSTKDGAVENVYAPIETFKTYWQDQGADPKAVARELLGSTEAYDQAVATGTDLEIPTALYAAKIAPTEHNAFFSRELRFDPEQMNAREEEEFEKAFQEEHKAAAPETAPQDSANRIREDIIGQMLETGYTREAVETNAAAVAESFRVTAERFGMDPFALYEPYKLKINRPVPEILRSMPDLDVTLDPMIDRLRAGSLPTQTEMLGTSLLEFLREKGGVLDDGGDLASREPDADLQPFQKKLIQEKGLPLDRAREAAAEAGYLDKQSSIADFLDVIEKELRGEPVYAQGQENAQAIEQHTVLEQLGGYLKSRDVDISKATNAEIKQLLQDAAEAPAIDAQTGMVLEQSGKIPRLGRLDENELGDFNRIEDLRAAGVAYFNLKFRQDLKQVERPGFGIVVFNRKGQDKIEGTSADPDKLRLIPKIPEIITDGKYIGHADVSGRKDQIVRFHYFDGLIEVGDRLLHARVSVGEDKRGRKSLFRFYNIVNNPDAAVERKKARGDPKHTIPGAQAVETDPSGPTSADNDTTTFDQDDVIALGMDQGPRGRILFAPSRRAFAGPITIELLEKADLSTFLHEFGHFYLEMFGDIADELRTRPDELSDTQRRMVEDYDAALKWLGVESRDAIGEEQHEQWARGFEAYLREGKVPNPELRSIFNRVASWLNSIYRSLMQLRVNLTPEVKAVMDRMLATDEQIAQAEQDGGILGMIEDQGMAERLGMTPKEFALYRDKVRAASDARKEALRHEYMEEYDRFSKEWFQARRVEVRDDVAGQVHQQREYIALSFLQKGKLPDGSPLPNGIQGVKLDAGILEERHGEYKDSSVMKALRKLDVYRRENGVDPDQAAEVLGYSSGDELVQALLKARDMNALIDAETDSRMREQYGDMLTDGTAAEKAKDAVMTEGRAEIVLDEIAALQKAKREAAPFVQSGKENERQEVKDRQAAGIAMVWGFTPKLSLVRLLAEQRIRDMRVKDVRPGTYFAAARNASRAATQAALEQNFKKALASKQQELLSVAMYEAATAAQKQVESTREYMNSFDKSSTRARIAKAGEDYLDQIDALRDRFQFSKITEKANQRRKTLTAWVADQEAKGLPVDVPAELLDESRQVNYRDATIQELAGLRDTIEHIASLARLKNKLLKSLAKRELDAAVADITGSIIGNSKGARPVMIEDEAPGESSRRGLKGFFAWQRKLASLARQMDGSKDGGSVWEYFIRPINAAADEETTMKEAATERYMKIVNIYSRAELAGMSQKQFVPAIGTSLSREARVMVALYWGNAEGRQRLAGGYGWNEGQVAAILETLEQKDLEFVKSTWAEVNSYWADIAAKQKRVYGVAPEKVEALSYSTKFGEMPGGYVPLKYSVTDPKTQAQSAGDIAERMMKGAFTKATTRRGFTKDRAETVNRRLRLSLNTIWEHTSEVIHDLTHHEMLIDVNRLLGNSKVQDAIVSNYGDITLRTMHDAVKDIAAGYVPVQQQGEKALEWVRQGTSIARMGWNTMTAVTQPLGLTVSIVRVGPKWIGRGIAHWLGDAVRMESSVGWIHGKSEFMRLRNKTQMREINEVRNKVNPRGSLVTAAIGRTGGGVGAKAGLAIGDTYGVVEDSYFWLIGRAQMVADVPTWLGAYEKAMANSANDEKRAVALADQAVIDSQGSGHIKDLAKVQRGTPALKIFTQFMSYFNVLYNQGAEALGRARPRDPASVGRLAVDVLMLYTVPMLLETALRGAIRGDDDDDESMIAKLAKEQLSYLLNTVVFARELSPGIEGFDYKGSAGEGFFAEATGLIKQIGQGEADTAAWKALNQTAGIFFHYPATQVQRLADAFAALEDKGAAVAFRTLISGKARS